MHSRHRRYALVAFVVLALTPSTAHATLAAKQVAPSQGTVSLFTTHKVFRIPRSNAKVLGRVRNERPITGVRTILPVVSSLVDGKGIEWLQVRLPGRVLGGKTLPATGWIKHSNTKTSTTPWRIVVNTRSRRVRVFHNGSRIRSYRAIVGKQSTPTPRGKFFVEEIVKLSAGQVGAPYALATSARSKVLRMFEGGPGQIALHGLTNVGGNLGTAQSHGCIRLSNRAITWIARHVGAGVPVTIS